MLAVRPPAWQHGWSTGLYACCMHRLKVLGATKIGHCLTCSASAGASGVRPAQSVLRLVGFYNALPVYTREIGRSWPDRCMLCAWPCGLQRLCPCVAHTHMHAWTAVEVERHTTGYGLCGLGWGNQAGISSYWQTSTRSSHQLCRSVLPTAFNTTVDRLCMVAQLQLLYFCRAFCCVLSGVTRAKRWWKEGSRSVFDAFQFCFAPGLASMPSPAADRVSPSILQQTHHDDGSKPPFSIG